MTVKMLVSVKWYPKRIDLANTSSKRESRFLYFDVCHLFIFKNKKLVCNVYYKFFF